MALSKKAEELLLVGMVGAFGFGMVGMFGYADHQARKAREAYLNPPARELRVCVLNSKQEPEKPAVIDSLLTYADSVYTASFNVKLTESERGTYTGNIWKLGNEQRALHPRSQCSKPHDLALMFSGVITNHGGTADPRAGYAVVFGAEASERQDQRESTVHELGHVFGMGHVSTPGNFMHWYSPQSGTDWSERQREYFLRRDVRARLGTYPRAVTDSIYSNKPRKTAPSAK
jgi:hypothetical protein